MDGREYPDVQMMSSRLCAFPGTLAGVPGRLRAAIPGNAYSCTRMRPSGRIEDAPRYRFPSRPKVQYYQTKHHIAGTSTPFSSHRLEHHNNPQHLRASSHDSMIEISKIRSVTQFVDDVVPERRSPVSSVGRAEDCSTLIGLLTQTNPNN